MSHRRRRISRVLLAVLAVTIVAGVVTYARRPGATQANEVTSATATQPQPQSTSPSDQPPAAAIPQVIGGVPVEATRQALPQHPPAPLRTETPTALVTQTPTGQSAGAGGPTSNSPAVTQTPDPAPLAGAPTPFTAKLAPPSSDPSKVSIKPYQPPAGSGHATAGGAIADARAKMQAGKLLEARDALNGPLVNGSLKGADADAARALLSEINQTVVFSTRKFADDRFGGTYKVESGDRLDRIGARYSVTADMLLRINGLSDARRLRAGAYIKVLKGPFHAVVSKSNFRLDLYLGGLPGPGAGDSVCYVTSFPVGLGKDDSTPLGKWQVEPDSKVKNPEYYSPRGEGVIAADDPKNPLGEYWIGLVGLDGDAVGKESYGVHGTIDPESIGKMESMGCIRLRNEDVAVVFSTLVDGKSTVQVVD